MKSNTSYRFLDMESARASRFHRTHQFPRMSHATSSFDMENAVMQYFVAWNSKGVAALSECFDKGVKLKDWDVSLEGIDAVVQGNAKIWETYPDIEILVTNMFISRGKKTAVTCELDVVLNDPAKTVLKVVDLFEFSNSGRISSVRAYKQ